MNTRLLTGIVLSAVFAMGSWLVFSNMLTASSTYIAIYVFLSCVVTSFALLTTGSSEGKSQHAESDGNQETTTLYVGNLPYRANEEAVKRFFRTHVPVQSVRLMKDKRTGKRKGYGFIEIVTNDVNAVIDKLNDIVFQERTLKVRPAKEKIEG